MNVLPFSAGDFSGSVTRIAVGSCFALSVAACAVATCASPPPLPPDAELDGAVDDPELLLLLLLEPPHAASAATAATPTTASRPTLVVNRILCTCAVPFRPLRPSICVLAKAATA